MDPLGTLAVAAAVTRFVDWSTRVLADTQEMYKSATGQTMKMVQVWDILDDLDQWRKIIDNELSATIYNITPGEACTDASLLDACHVCRAVIDDIKAELKTLEDRNSSMRRRSSRGGGFEASTAFVCLLSAIKGDYETKAKKWRLRLATLEKELTRSLITSLW